MKTSTKTVSRNLIAGGVLMLSAIVSILQSVLF